MKFDGPAQFTDAITDFHGLHFPLSNFYPHPITIAGLGVIT